MQTQSFKIKSKPFEGESKVWLVALDIITKNGGKEKIQRYSLSIDEATELANNIRVASYTAKNQNSKNK